MILLAHHPVPSRTLGNDQGMSGGYPIFLGGEGRVRGVGAGLLLPSHLPSAIFQTSCLYLVVSHVNLAPTH